MIRAIRSITTRVKGVRTLAYAQDTFCSFCGTAHSSDGWPKTCNNCHNTSYKNPTPVAIGVVPVTVPNEGLGVMLVRRADDGRLAFPGGYMDNLERWADALSREIMEETSVHVPAIVVQ